MQIVIRQTFPLGRFHATPWRVNPFDDPHGEWPPSPWRLIRAVTSRWHQWMREAIEEPNVQQLDTLVTALCASSYCFHLPVHTRAGKPLRQYFPQEFGWNPKGKKKAGTRSYSTSLAQDNYWCVAPDEAVWWFLESEKWTEPLADMLDRCLERITYFGRAESFSQLQRSSESAPKPNCTLMDKRAPGTIPIVVPRADATRDDIERVSGNIMPTIPPGARTMYALRPTRPPTQETPLASTVRRDCNLFQFAIGWNVAPKLRAIVRLTARFRGSVIQDLVRIKTGDPKATWSRAGANIREAIFEMTGKDGRGKPLTGPHRHTEFLAWCEDGIPTRLLVWRDGRPFDDDEHAAILRAAVREQSWTAAGSDAGVWRVKLVPLDCAVPAPPGFDGVPARIWESVTLYVPPRHDLRRGKPRPREAVELQVQRELTLRGLAGANDVEVEQFGRPSWVVVHIPRTRATKRAFIGDRRGYRLRLTFREPMEGPLRLGHSSSFGLGLFRPV